MQFLKETAVSTTASIMLRLNYWGNRVTDSIANLTEAMVDKVVAVNAVLERQLDSLESTLQSTLSDDSLEVSAMQDPEGWQRMSLIPDRTYGSMDTLFADSRDADQADSDNVASKESESKESLTRKFY